MDHSTKHPSIHPSEKHTVFASVCELIQQQLPPLLRRVLRNTRDHEKWPLDDKEKLKFLKLLDDKERIVISSFMFQLKKILEHFEKSGHSPLRVVPRVERSQNSGIYFHFNESIMQRLSDIVGRPPIPLTENPVHLFNLKQCWNYAIESLFLEKVQRAIMVNTFEKQFAPQLGSFYGALDSLMFDAGILTKLPVSRLSLRNPANYADTVKSSLGDVGVAFSHLILAARQKKAVADKEARQRQELNAEIKRQILANRDKLDKRQAYLFDNLWQPYLKSIAINKGTDSKSWKKALSRLQQFNESLQPCNSRQDIRRLLESWKPANKTLNKILDKISVSSQNRQVLSDFYARNFDQVLKISVEQAAAAIKAARPLSASGVCRQSEDFKRLFEGLQLPVSEQTLDLIAKASSAPTSFSNSGYLNTGEWAEMKQANKSGRLMVKLAWKADDSSKYIFVDRSGNRICELDHAELQEKISNGELTPVNQIGVRSAGQNLSTLRTL